MANKPRAAIFWTIISLIPFLGILWGIVNPADYKSWQQYFQQWLAPLGFFGPIVFVFVQAVQVVITPISHYVVGAAGGFLYGFFWGGVLNYIGRLIGHIAAYFLADKLRGFIERRGWVSQETFSLYDRIFGGKTVTRYSVQTLILFLIYFLPLFPDDEISYLVGFARMPFIPFLLANLFGHLGGSFSLALIGAGIDTHDPWFWILTILTFLGFPLLWYLHSRVLKKDAHDR
ncbi:MAG: VTT domain-containing protein [Pyrinomonadaceae bacterium]